jgi:hypothetical protein
MCHNCSLCIEEGAEEIAKPKAGTWAKNMVGHKCQSYHQNLSKVLEHSSMLVEIECRLTLLSYS